MSDWTPTEPDADIETWVFQALGAASMCWDETPHGVFDSTRAKSVGDALVARIRRYVLADDSQRAAGEPPAEVCAADVEQEWREWEKQRNATMERVIRERDTERAAAEHFESLWQRAEVELAALRSAGGSGVGAPTPPAVVVKCRGDCGDRDCGVYWKRCQRRATPPCGHVDCGESWCRDQLRATGSGVGAPTTETGAP